MSALLDSYEKLKTQSDSAYLKLIKLLDQQDPIWIPQTGPQEKAWLSQADELYYGGQAGGGKSDLLIGLALTAHKNSIIFRRNYTQFRGGEGLLQRTANIVGNYGRFSGRINGWFLKDGRTLEFGAVEHLTDMGKWRGRAHDFKGFDELPEFAEAQYLFLIGWLRSADPKQRTRIVGAGNPPLSDEGEWVIRRWAAWLDPAHKNPANPGELRWYARIENKDVEVEDGSPIYLNDEEIKPRSRTFIPASLKENVFLKDSDYASVLQGLPEPMRSQLLYGDFSVGRRDDPWQVIPSSWVDAAMKRWSEDSKPNEEATAAGLDVARGGEDKTVLSQRWGTWFSPLRRWDGIATPDGMVGRQICVEALTRGGYVNVDVIGVGAAVVDLCRDADLNVRPIHFAMQVKRKDRTNLLKFTNVRAFAYWSMREALDPETGDNLALPPDSELKADLCSARWAMRVSGIQIESKDEIRERLGRSPDAGDAVVMCAMPPIGAEVRFY